MPFHDLPQGVDARQVTASGFAGLEYAAQMPEPLLVAILDREEEREGRTTAVLARGFLYDHPPSGARIAVPEGYVTDFASIPKVAQFAFPPFGRHAKAAVLHDWLYGIGEPDRKAFADAVLRDAMTELQVNAERRDIMYQAVRLFGGDAYNRADDAWKTSWARWRTGEPCDPTTARQDHYHQRWPRPPRDGYMPD